MLRKLVQSLTATTVLTASIVASAANVDTLLRRDTDPVAGNPEGKVTVVEFFDYQCSHCVNMAPVIEEIIKANPDVRIVFKDLPIRGPMSEFAAKAAIAASKQGKYYPFSHSLLTTNLSLTQDNVYEIAKNSGVDVTQLKKDIQNNNTTKQLRSNAAVAQAFNVNGTPAFFIGKTDATDSNQLNFVLGEMSTNELQSAIDKAKN